MKNPNNMIVSPERPKPDRLAAFFETFDLFVAMVPSEAASSKANLVVTGRDGQAEQVLFRARGTLPSSECRDVLVAATAEFGGVTNPLVNALPETVVLSLAQRPALHSLVAAFVTEGQDDRCGRRVALNRLCEVIVLLVLREAIDTGSTEPGLLAGLSHPALRRAIVAMHDEPAKPWCVEELAEMSGMSRSHFMALFPKVLGTTPSAYLNVWRLTLGRRELMRGERVKSVAQRVGFGSAAAFSRAYSRTFGCPPQSARDTQ